jgi:hypothetical protein
MTTSKRAAIVIQVAIRNLLIPLLRYGGAGTGVDLPDQARMGSPKFRVRPRLGGGPRSPDGASPLCHRIPEEGDAPAEPHLGGRGTQTTMGSWPVICTRCSSSGFPGWYDRPTSDSSSAAKVFVGSNTESQRRKSLKYFRREIETADAQHNVGRKETILIGPHFRVPLNNNTDHLINWERTGSLKIRIN